MIPLYIINLKWIKESITKTNIKHEKWFTSLLIKLKADKRITCGRPKLYNQYDSMVWELNQRMIKESQM